MHQRGWVTASTPFIMKSEEEVLCVCRLFDSQRFHAQLSCFPVGLFRGQQQRRLFGMSHSDFPQLSSSSSSSSLCFVCSSYPPVSFERQRTAGVKHAELTAASSGECKKNGQREIPWKLPVPRNLLRYFHTSEKCRNVCDGGGRWSSKGSHSHSSCNGQNIKNMSGGSSSSNITAELDPFVRESVQNVSSEL